MCQVLAAGPPAALLAHGASAGEERAEQDGAGKTSRHLSCAEVSEKTMAFYYLWYSNPQYGYEWGNWDDGGQKPPLEVYSTYYPVLGCYSSNQDDVIRKHFEWLERAGIGVAIIPYFGGGGWIEETAEKVFAIAKEYKVKICYQMEIYRGRTLDGIRQDIKRLMDKWGKHPRIFRYGGKMMFFVFDPMNRSYGPEQFSLSDWKTTIRRLRTEGYRLLVIAGTLDCTWLNAFDGLYQYDIVGFASRHSTLFPSIATECRSRGKIFAPSIGPGFDNSRLVSGKGTPLVLERRGTAQYDEYWQTIVRCDPTFVTIVSFNEWGESTNIEPASSHPPAGYHYATFSGTLEKTGTDSETVFIDRTKYWVRQYDRSLLPSRRRP